jgi:hypothetical protein
MTASLNQPSPRPTVLVSNEAIVRSPDKTQPGIAGPLGRSRVLFALPLNKAGPVQLQRAEIINGPPAAFAGDPQVNLIGFAGAAWVHRMLTADRTTDTRRL